MVGVHNKESNNLASLVYCWKKKNMSLVQTCWYVFLSWIVFLHCLPPLGKSFRKWFNSCTNQSGAPTTKKTDFQAGFQIVCQLIVLPIQLFDFHSLAINSFCHAAQLWELFWLDFKLKCLCSSENYNIHEAKMRSKLP